PAMRITNFIKNYPCTLITFAIISIGISIICMPTQVYAKLNGEKSLSYYCACMEYICNTDISCKDGSCPLKVGNKIRRNCELNKTDKCLHIYKGERGCCDNGCHCNDMCTEYCGINCEVVTVRYINDCKNGKCDYEAL
ncbi:MAG: hypothetical protein ACP5KS_13550, partial [Candidatus Hydrogenedens sp.]